MYMFFMVGGVGIFLYLQVMISTKASARIATKVKIAYLKAILNQESAWFDQTNCTELSGKLDNEVNLIERGLGEKMGTIW